MGTPSLAVPSLRAIHRVGHAVLAVVSQPDRPVGRHQVTQPTPTKQAAQDLGLDVHQPEKIRTEAFERWVADQMPDVIVVVAYGRLLPAGLLRIPQWGCLNVHFSLLPKYRGAAPVNWALARGERETGVTTMLMDEGMDSGPILLQDRTRIDPDETAATLGERLAVLGADLLVETLEGMALGGLTPQPQDHAQATLAPMLKRETGLIDWGQGASEIRDRIRGFQPWPGAWTTWKGLRLHLCRARALEATTGQEKYSWSGPPGSVIITGQNTLGVICGACSLLEVEELQLEGRKRLTAPEFLRGYRLQDGDRLGS